MVLTGAKRRRRVRHALSILKEGRTFLENNPSANDVAIVCIDGSFRSVQYKTCVKFNFALIDWHDFRMSSLVLSAASPTLRESLLESVWCGGGAPCEDLWGWGNDGAAHPNAVVVVDRAWGVSVDDMAHFFGMVFQCGFDYEEDDPKMLAAIKRVCLALKVVESNIFDYYRTLTTTAGVCCRLKRSTCHL